MAMSAISNAARSAMCDALVDLLDGGTIEIQDASSTVLAVLTFGTPAFGAASNGVATANTITADSDANATGTASKAIFKTSGGTATFQLTVGTSAADVILTTVSISQHDTVDLDGTNTITMPAS